MLSKGLERLLAAYPGLDLARGEDGPSLLDFFDRSAMHTTSVALRYERSPDFFALQRARSARALTFIGREADARVSFVVSFSGRDAYWEGRSKPLCYVADLRVERDSTMRRRWKNFGADIKGGGAEIPEIANASYFLAALVEGNERAKRAFVDPGPQAFVYESLSPYRMINIMGAWRRTGASRELKIRPATAADLPELKKFLDRQHRNRFFGYRFDAGELERRLEHWPALALTDFILLNDAQGCLRGCVAPWSPSPKVKRTFVDRLPWLYRVLGASRLADPWVRMPVVGQEFGTLYMTHFEVDDEFRGRDRTAAARALIDASFERFRRGKWHSLAFADYPQRSLEAALGGYFVQRMPMTLYLGRHRDTLALTKDEFSADAVPAFEMTLV